MAREVIIRKTDDFNRELDASETREIGYNGLIYVLDLTDEHAKELEELLTPYLQAAHEKVKWPKRQLQEALKATTPATQATPITVKAVVDKEKRQRIRAWGRRNGFEVSDRGYIRDEVVQAYAEAHKGRKNA